MALQTYRSSVFLFGGLLAGFIFSKLSLTLLSSGHNLPNHCDGESFAFSTHQRLSSPFFNGDNNSRNWKASVRPQFLASELGIRERLLIVVLLSSELAIPYAEAFKESTEFLEAQITYLHHDNVPAFDLQAVTITTPGSLGMLEYVAYKRVDQFDFYLLIPDTTYVNGFALKRLLDSMTAGDDVIVSFPSEQDRSCSLNTGLLISNLALKALLPRIALCILKDKSHHSASQHSMEHCLNDKLSCLLQWKGRKALSVKAGAPLENIQNIVTVEQIARAEQLVQLKLEFKKAEHQILQAEVDRVRAELLHLYGEENMTVALPFGTAEPWRSSRRHDLLLWDFFDEENIFEVSNEWNYAPLNAAQREDVQTVTKFAVDWLKKNGKVEGMTFKRLLNGYRRFDPVRGMEYVLDLEFSDRAMEVNHRRVFLLRALSRAEILPVPFVTEDTSVTVVLPVAEMDVDAALTFLNNFRKYFVPDEKCKLVALFMLTHIAERDRFDGLIRLLNSWRLQIRSIGLQHRINYMVLKVKRFSVADVLDHLTSRMKQSELLMIASPWLEAREEMLNRVRVNTIENFQVFFPVPFVRYHPYLAAGMNGNQNSKLHLDISRDTGQFQMLNFETASFYSSDYLRARAAQTEGNFQATITMEQLFSAFLRYGDVHVLRAIDPSFRLRHPEPQCKKRYNRTKDVEQCLLEEKENLGSKAQLASFIFNRV